MSVLDEICRKVRITDYLEAKGHELSRAGNRVRCRCPLPDHDERTPSFYIGEFEDGAQFFKCFGCDASGNTITLIRLMEGKKSNGAVLRDLAREHGVEMKGFEPDRVRLEPLPEDVLMHFCEIEYPALNIAAYGRAFLECMGNTDDSVNKVSRLYKRLDRMLELGNAEGVERIYEQMGDLLVELGGREWVRQMKVGTKTKP